MILKSFCAHFYDLKTWHFFLLHPLVPRVQFTGRKLNEALGENPMEHECVHYAHVNQVMQNVFCDVCAHTHINYSIVELPHMKNQGLKNAIDALEIFILKFHSMVNC